MSLEEFLSYRPPSYKKILPSVDLEWNIVDAYHLIDTVCYIMNLLENDEKGEYIKLYDYLEKKETYLELYTELCELMDKHKFPRHTQYKEFPEYEDQVLLHYWDHLEHADMLVARDNAWIEIFHRDDY